MSGCRREAKQYKPPFSLDLPGPYVPYTSLRIGDHISFCLLGAVCQILPDSFHKTRSCWTMYSFEVDLWMDALRSIWRTYLEQKTMTSLCFMVYWSELKILSWINYLSVITMATLNRSVSCYLWAFVSECVLYSN